MAKGRFILGLFLFVFSLSFFAPIAQAADITPPTVNLISPVNESINTTEITRTLTYSAVDLDSGVDITKVFLNDIEIAKISGDSIDTFVEGANVVRVESTDFVGNVGFAEATIFVDTLVEAPTFDPLPTIWHEDTYTITGKMENGSTVDLTPPGAVVAESVTYPTASSWSCDLSNLSNGSLEFVITATDPLGNVSDPRMTNLNVTLAPLPLVAGELTATDTLLGGSVDISWEAYSYPADSFALYVSDTAFTDVTGMTPLRTYTAVSTAQVTGLNDNVTSYLALVPEFGGIFNPSVTTTSIVAHRQGLFGTVQDTNSNPLNQIAVTVPGYSPVMTAADGTYRISGIAVANYTVTAAEVGGDTRFVGSSTATDVIAGEVTELNFSLAVKDDTLPPATPATMTAIAGDGQVTIEWSAVADPDLAGYSIERTGASGMIQTVPAATTRFVDRSVTNDNLYTYTVSAYSLTDVYSAATPTADATPVAAPAAPHDLVATLNCDNTVTLTWQQPVSNDLSGYNVYQDTGETATYNTFEPVVDAVTTNWTSSPLTSGETYTFAVRGNGAATETNTNVRATLTVPVNWNTPLAMISLPLAGTSVSGNALHVQAKATNSACGSGRGDIDTVQFQYRESGTIPWLDVPAALAKHPNPDLGAPWFTKWDVSGLAETDVELRAVAANSVGSDTDAAYITVTIDHQDPQLSENKSDDGTLTSQVKVEKDRQTAIASGDASATFPVGSLTGDTLLTLTTLPIEQQPLGSDTLLVDPVDLSLQSAQSSFSVGNEVEVGLTYADANNDDLIDGTGIFVQDAETVVYNSTSVQWDVLPDSTIDTTNKKVKGKTSHFSTFGIKVKGGMPAASSPSSFLAPASNTTGKYSIYWQGIDNAGVIYEVEVDDGNGFVPLTSTSNTIAYLSGQDSGTYTYRVRSAAPGHEPSPWRFTSIVAVTLTCATPGHIYTPASPATGQYTFSWHKSSTPGVTYDVEINDGSGFKYLTTTSNNYLTATMPSGTYQYRVKAVRTADGYLDSGWKMGSVFNVILSCATPGHIYTPATNYNGEYTISWHESSTSGVSYVLQETDDNWATATTYNLSNNYMSFKNKANGTYQYRVKAVRSSGGYLDSGWKMGPAFNVTLACAPPGHITGPASGTTGNYKIAWHKSSTQGASYVLQETDDNWETTTTYNLSKRVMSFKNKANGTYQYRVKAVRSGYLDSGWKMGLTFTVGF